MSPQTSKAPQVGKVHDLVINSQRTPSDATKLATLLTETGSETTSLFTLLQTTAQDTVAVTRGKITDGKAEEIEAVFDFYTSTASQIDISITHKGNSDTLPPLSQQRRPKQTIVRATKGPALLAEHLGSRLWHELYTFTTRVYTPVADEEPQLGVEYYRPTFEAACLLARSFSSQPNLRSGLWPTVEYALIQGLFSKTQQAPGNFLVVAVLLQGAGVAVQEWLTRSQGKGKDWDMWTDTLLEPEATWEWRDIRSALRNVDSLVDPDFERTVPQAVMESFKGLDTYLDEEHQDWKAKKLADTWLPHINNLSKTSVKK